MLLTLVGRPPDERTDVLRAGGRGGGDSFGLAVGGGGAVAEGKEAVWTGAGQEVVATGSGDVTSGTGLGNGGCSMSDGAGLVARLTALVEVMLVKLPPDSEVKDGREAWLGRRGGGGAGACIATRRLDDRDRVESCDERRCPDKGSSVKVDSVCKAGAALGAKSLLSDREWGLRLGGGAGFLGSGGLGVVMAACEAFGGVGGRGVGMASASASTSICSGTLPADSRSNMLSPPSSIERRVGAGGSGLFTSDGVSGHRLEDAELPPGELGPILWLADEDVSRIPSIPGPLVLSFERSTLMTFPWRELGGGGFFLRVETVWCVLACGLLSRPSRSSSPSASDISCDVLGVSCTRLASNMD